MNYLETIKNIGKNKEKRVENLIFLVILLVIVLFASKFIFSKSEKTPNTLNSTNIKENTNSKGTDTADSKSVGVNANFEVKLANILSQISGISEVSVALTYSQDEKKTPIYNTKEQEKQGEKTTEKTVVYDEEGSNKKAVIETVEMPKVEGAIVVAKGAETVEMRSKIASAVSVVTNLPVYKIQVFEKQG